MRLRRRPNVAFLHRPRHSAMEGMLIGASSGGMLSKHERSVSSTGSGGSLKFVQRHLLRQSLSSTSAPTYSTKDAVSSWHLRQLHLVQVFLLSSSRSLPCMATFDTAPYTPRFEDNIPDSTARRLDQ